MGIEKLYKALVVAPAGRSEALMDRLVKFGEFHAAESDQKILKHLEPQYLRVRRIYHELEGLAKNIDASSGPGVIEVLLKGESEPLELHTRNVKEIVDRLESEASELVSKYEELSKKRQTLGEEINRLEGEVAELRLRATTGLDLSLLSSIRYFYCALFICSRKDLPELKAAFEQALIISRSLERSKVQILVVAPRSEEERVERIVRGFDLVRIRPVEGEDRELLLKRLREAEERLRALTGELETIETQIKYYKLSHGMRVAALRDLSSKLLDNLHRLRSEAGRIVVLEGYIPARSREELLNRVGDLAYVQFSEIQHLNHHSAELEQPPTLLKNNPVTESFRPVTLVQGPPSYYEIDPTPLVSVFLSVFYGIMFADLGQGLVIAAVGIILTLRARAGLRLWGKLLTILGASSATGGFLIQEAFGFKLTPITGMKPILELVEHHGEAVNLNPSAVLTLFTFAPLLGVLHVSIGLALSSYILLKHGELGEAIFSKAASLLMYIFGVLFGIAFIGAGSFDRLFTSEAAAPLIGLPISTVGSIGVYGVLAGIALIVGGRAVGSLIGLFPRQSIVSHVGTGLLEILENIIHFMSNTLSYLRISILMIIHIALMLLINSAWEALGPASIGILVIGNIGVMGLEGLLVFIQSLRLHLYEFFSKFFTGSGTIFRPLSLQTERVRVVFMD